MTSIPYFAIFWFAIFAGSILFVCLKTAGWQPAKVVLELRNHLGRCRWWRLD
jgi:hypothetical protein